jgi:hypothetical protein
MAEFALIPRTIPRHPKKKAVSLAGGANRTLFKMKFVHIT